MMIGVLDETGTAVAAYPLTDIDLFRRFPGRHKLSLAPQSVRDELGIVEIVETPEPPLSYGESLVEGPPEPVGDGTWRQTWQVVPADLPGVRRELRDDARALLNERVEDLHAAEKALLAELERYEDAGSPPNPNAADYPLLAAIRTRRGGSVAATVAYVTALRDTWTNRAARWLPLYLEVIDAIQAAPDAASAKAAFDSYAAATPA